MNYISYHFTIKPLEPWREIIIAELGDVGFESFVETETGLTAYIGESLDDEKFIQGFYPMMSTEVKIIYTREVIEKVNWNAEWERSFEPILIDDRCYVRAEFHEEKPEIPFQIIIQPKMSFGTGHHETTHLMLQSILDRDVTKLSVLDMGAGTAVLGILAKLKGAKYVEAIDIDEWAHENAIENANRNKVNLTIKLGGSEQLSNTIFDLILANINKNILMADIKNYSKVLKNNGELILSGLYNVDFDDVVTECRKNGLKFVKKLDKNDWICIHLIKL